MTSCRPQMLLTLPPSCKALKVKVYHLSEGSLSVCHEPNSPKVSAIGRPPDFRLLGPAGLSCIMYEKKILNI